mgnify:CR=1 FL=1
MAVATVASGPAVAAFLPAGLPIEQKSALLFSGLLRMTFVAMLDQNRPHLVFKKTKPLGVGARNGRAGYKAQQGGE